MQRLNLLQEFRKQFIKEHLPDVLYHYTSIEGFKGIIDGKEIGATPASHLLGDPTEITHAKEIAREILRERKRGFNGKEELYEYCESTINGLDGLKEFLCIASFSEEKDLLSQWRAYCPKGGVSIGFSVPKISENNQYLYNNNNYYVNESYIYKCIYKEEEQRKKINQLFDFLLERTEDTGKLKGFFNKTLQTFSYSFKHKSFEEEVEWRLVCFLFPEEHRLKDRVKDSIIKPYLPFLIVDNNDNIIIKKIRIGPSRDKEKLRKYISSYLKNLGKQFSHIKIDVTETPWQP
jgi:hypothetical protein